jgi:protein TonB
MRKLMVIIGILGVAGVVTISLFGGLGLLFPTENPATRSEQRPDGITPNDDPRDSPDETPDGPAPEPPPEKPEPYPIPDLAKPSEMPPCGIHPCDTDLTPREQQPEGGVRLVRDPQPIVRVPPQYPRRAAQDGIEGYVRVEFTITKEGRVTNPFVVESSHPIFEQPSLDAIVRWKYRPQMRDGKPIDVPGIQVMFEYTIEDAEEE